MAYFPMFVQLKKKKCLVIGGGKIALRKIEVLKDFEADITCLLYTSDAAETSRV